MKINVNFHLRFFVVDEVITESEENIWTIIYRFFTETFIALAMTFICAKILHTLPLCAHQLSCFDEQCRLHVLLVASAVNIIGV
jgi:hypothetical protein